jgi:hypothetical protein
MTPIPLLIALVLPPNYTASDIERATAAARESASMHRFVGPRLPPPSTTQTSESSPPPRLTATRPSRPSPPPPPPRPKFYVDGHYIRNSSGGVVAQFGACRSCAQVRAGIHIRRR